MGRAAHRAVCAFGGVTEKNYRAVYLHVKSQRAKQNQTFKDRVSNVYLTSEFIDRGQKVTHIPTVICGDYFVFVFFFF